MSADDQAAGRSHDRAVRPVRKALSIVAGQILLIAGFYLVLMPDRNYFQIAGGVAVIATGVALLFQGRVRGRLLLAKPMSDPAASLDAARGPAIDEAVGDQACDGGNY